MKYELTEKEKSELLTKERIVYYNSSGEYHREDGPAVIYADGDQLWYINNKFHREDGPAVTWANGNQYWWINGKRHREYGPAVTWADGDQEWWINGEYVTDKVVTWAKSCDIDLDNASDENKFLLKIFINGVKNER